MNSPEHARPSIVTLTKLFYKPAEAADVLSRGRTKVWEAIRSGELRSITAGRSRLIPAQALLDYAEHLARGDAGSEPTSAT